MAEIINLRQVRKHKEREAARQRGLEAAIKTGRSKALKALEKARADKERSAIDSHLRDKQD